MANFDNYISLLKKAIDVLEASQSLSIPTVENVLEKQKIIDSWQEAFQKQNPQSSNQNQTLHNELAHFLKNLLSEIYFYQNNLNTVKNEK